jgi:predicted phage-related endonuclease
MTAQLLGQMEPGTEEWDTARRWAVGGSEIAVVLGLSPWKSRFTLYLEKKGLTAAEPDKPIQEWGRRIEPVVRDKFAETHPGDWRANPGVYKHSVRTWSGPGLQSSSAAPTTANTASNATTPTSSPTLPFSAPPVRSSSPT